MNWKNLEQRLDRKLLEVIGCRYHLYFSTATALSMNIFYRHNVFACLRLQRRHSIEIENAIAYILYVQWLGVWRRRDGKAKLQNYWIYCLVSLVIQYPEEILSRTWTSPFYLTAQCSVTNDIKQQSALHSLSSSVCIQRSFKNLPTCG